MTESAAVAPEGLTTPQDTDMWNDEQQAVWTRIVEFGHSQGAAMAIQLAHAGRDASMYRGFPAEPEGYVQPADEGWTTVGPSAVAYPGAPCATCADHRGDRRRRAGVRRRCPAL